MQNPFDGKEIWFLTGSQNLYGEETLIQVAEQSQEIANGIDAAVEVPIKVVWKPVLKDSDSIKELMLEANANPNLALTEDLATSALSSGVGYDALLERIMRFGISYQAAWRQA